VGLGNVTNESKATMFTSPTFTGTTTVTGPLNSSEDATAGTAIALPVQIYRVLTSTIVTLTSTGTGYSKFFPAVLNLAASTTYEVEYKLWIDQSSLNNSNIYWGILLSQAPNLFNSWSRTSYAYGQTDGLGDIVYSRSDLYGVTPNSIEIGRSLLYANTPHYVHVIIEITTTSAATQLTLTGAFSGGNSGNGRNEVRLVKNSHVKLTKMPASNVGTFS
jgi:hypothetical protein